MGFIFDRPRGVEWLNDVFQRHINALETELLETAQVTFGPPPNPPFFNSRALSSRLGGGGGWLILETVNILGGDGGEEEAGETSGDQQVEI